MLHYLSLKSTQFAEYVGINLNWESWFAWWDLWVLFFEYLYIFNWLIKNKSFYCFIFSNFFSRYTQLGIISCKSHIEEPTQVSGETNILQTGISLYPVDRSSNVKMFLNFREIPSVQCPCKWTPSKLFPGYFLKSPEYLNIHSTKNEVFH